MFALSDVKHAYGGRTVIAVPEWRAAQGEHWLLLGPSGSGKTTLLHIMAGLLAPDRGKVVIAEQDLAALPPSERDRFRGRTVGIVFQRLHLVEALSVAQNLAMVQYFAGLPGDRGRIVDVLDQLAIGDKADAFPRDLSQGEAQRVALARAVINGPKVILADEPTSSLDDENCARVLGLLVREAQACGATLVIATHDQRAKLRFDRRCQLGARP